MEKITKNKLAIKIICVALSVILWLYVSYHENPSMTKTIRNVPLVLTGEQALKENGLAVYSVSDNTVDVKVTASRLTLARLSKKTVSAIINVSSVKDTGTHTMPVAAASSITADASFYVKGKDIKIVVEKISRKSFVPEIDIEESQDTSLYLDNVQISTDEVMVTAPDSIINEISHVKTEHIIPDKENLQQSVKLVVYAKNGKVLEGAECEPNEVRVSYSFLDVKTVPVVFKTEGGKKHTLSADNSIKICGSGSAFEAIKEIETETVDISPFTPDSTVRVKLSLPSGIKTLDGKNEIEVVLEDKFYNN